MSYPKGRVYFLGPLGLDVVNARGQVEWGYDVGAAPVILWGHVK